MECDKIQSEGVALKRRNRAEERKANKELVQVKRRKRQVGSNNKRAREGEYDYVAQRTSLDDTNQAEQQPTLDVLQVDNARATAEPTEVDASVTMLAPSIATISSTSAIEETPAALHDAEPVLQANPSSIVRDQDVEMDLGDSLVVAQPIASIASSEAKETVAELPATPITTTIVTSPTQVATPSYETPSDMDISVYEEPIRRALKYKK